MIKNFVAIIPAAGIGSRFNGDTPKQYIKIDGKTILERSIEKIINHKFCLELVVCTSEEDIWFDELEISRDPRIKKLIGGKTRSESVLKGVNYFNEKNRDFSRFLIHDSVRPCLDDRDLTKILDTSQEDFDGFVLGFPATDTLKNVTSNNKIEITIDREKVWHAQTPQVFSKEILISAFKNKEKIGEFTDEASLLEAQGAKIQMVNGSPNNIKLTYKEDLNTIKSIIRNTET